MNRLEFIILSDNAFTDPNNGKLSIIGVFDDVQTQGFPTLASQMAIVVKVFLEVGEYKHKVLITKNRSKLFELDKIPVTKKLKNGFHQYIHLMRNVPFDEPGVYTVEVYLNDALFGSKEFNVLKV